MCLSRLCISFISGEKRKVLWKICYKKGVVGYRPLVARGGGQVGKEVSMVLVRAGALPGTGSRDPR